MCVFKIFDLPVLVPISQPLETAEPLGTTRWTEARSDDDCVAGDRTVQYLIRNLI